MFVPAEPPTKVLSVPVLTCAPAKYPTKVDCPVSLAVLNNLPEGLEDRITTRDIKDELEALISEYPTRADAARALIQHEGGLKGKSMEEQQLAFEERKGIEEGEEMAPVQLEGGFVPFEEDMDIEGMEEPPFAVQEATTEEVAAMQDIVKDYIDDGTTSLSEIKKAIAKELGYNTKKLRQTIEDAYTKYTTTEEAAVIEVKSGLLGRIGNAFGKMFGKEAQKPFISKDGKALVAKAKNVAETGGRVSFQATLPNGQNITAKPVDASIVNGFYSPLELQINQMKQDKMPAKQWLDKLRGEEARWTGLSDWLSQQEGSLAKEEIKNWEDFHGIEHYIDFSCDRKGQDVRYALDDSKIRNLGWEPKSVFTEEIPRIVNHYKNKFIW